MLKNKYNLFFLGILTAAGILFVGGYAYSDYMAPTVGVGGYQDEIEVLNKKISDNKAKVKDLEKSISTYKTKINQTRLEAVSLSNQMSILDNRTAQVELDIEATQHKMDTLELEIEALDIQVEKKEEVLFRQKQLIAELLRTIQQSDQKKYIEIAAAYDNFSEFYNQIQYVETVEEGLGNSIKTIRVTKEALEKAQIQKTERRETYESMKEDLVHKKEALEEQLYMKEHLLAQTQSSELTFNTLLSQLKQEYQQVENEISGIEDEVRRKLEAQNKLNGTKVQDDGKLSWPSDSRYVTAYFHDPDYPFRHIFEHNAIDLAISQGTPLKAAASGYVARARHCDSPACYSYVMIVHNNGLSTVYGHLSGITVQEDQFVARGDLVGYSGGRPGTNGAGPFSTGAHLHMEVRKDGIPVNPLNYLVKDW
ncbi:peptidoglycan DD-metalloendopeptidase family protein [Patescibacteria group bacterium]|nr:peptidoglycan DD-metalloendopeptidase family protein [Patescibacteria group bacterium]MBU1721927.1 peptidoglycan DD-metalloendopeptidase family protein [Patescibacteria group bacterium]MBU1901546.1 peptidoglycan DD-metalloendopeptidase family protein [Patescibacteria group bacterium]